MPDRGHTKHNKIPGMKAGKTQENNLRRMVSIWKYAMTNSAPAPDTQVRCMATYSLDSIYLETALKHNAVFVTLDDLDFLSRIKERVG